MLKVYILILLTKWGCGHQSVAIEFKSGAACRNAIVEFEKRWTTEIGGVAFCVPKDL